MFKVIGRGQRKKTGVFASSKMVSSMAISAIGQLMDMQPQDAAVQLDAINAFSQLTAYGGVARRPSS